jgi:RCR-type E3 ubiquitin transferase
MELNNGRIFQKKQWNQLPANFQKILRAWNELNEQLWQKIEIMENGEKIKSESENDLTENAKNEEKNVGNLLPHCELCGTKCTKPIGNHMRQKHPGCGGPTQTYGYNSAGHWTTGWSGKCGEGGQGKAVSS